VLVIIACLNSLVIAGLAFWWYRSLEDFSKLVFWPSLVLKLAAGLSLGLLYRHYYGTGDTFYFYLEATKLADLFYSNAWEYIQFIMQHPEAVSREEGSLRTTFLVKVISIFAILTNNNYWITSLWFSFISFLASFHLFKVVTSYFNKSEIAAAIAFLFFPSIVFWSSGVIKESIGMAALFMLVAFYLRVLRREQTIFDFFIVLLCLWIVWNLKYYWLAVFLPVVITSLVCHFGFHYLKFSLVSKFICWLFLFLFLTVGISLTRPNFYLDRIFGVIVDNYQAFSSISDKNDLIEYYNLSANWMSMVLNSPWAIFSGLFRPFLWEADNILKIVISVENLIIFVLCIFSLIRIKEIFITHHKLLTISVFIYTILLCVFLALSTPNLGSLSRYRVGFLPFFVFLISYQNPMIEQLTLYLKLNRNTSEKI